MATLYITEYGHQGREQGAGIPIGYGEPLAAYSMPIGGGSTTPGAPNATFQLGTIFIRVHTDVVCSISIGDSPVASTAATRMAANQTEYFGVAPGQTIAAILNS